MANPIPLNQPSNDPIAASTRLVESAIGLARAELRLAIARAGFLVMRAFGVLLAVAIAMPFVQVTLALVALGPLLGARETPLVVLVAIGVPLVVSTIAVVCLYRVTRSLIRDLQQLSTGE